jgi:hypothetical protein
VSIYLSEIVHRSLISSCSYPIGITDWAAKNAIPSNNGEDFGNFKRYFPSKI